MDLNFHIPKIFNNEKLTALISLPESEKDMMPEIAMLKESVDQVQSMDLAEKKDENETTVFFARRPKPAKIIKRKTINKLNITEWTLESGN